MSSFASESAIDATDLLAVFVIESRMLEDDSSLLSSLFVVLTKELALAGADNFSSGNEGRFFIVSMAVCAEEVLVALLFFA